MTDSNRALSEVPALIEERRRYESWLTALEARRDSTPAHVYERVQSDYRARLQQVAERLASHREALEAERTSIESRLSLLEAEEQMRRDERAELDLRAQVGELSATDAAEALGSLDTSLGELEAEKTSMREKVDAVRGLLGESSGKPATAPAPAPPAPGKRVTGALGSAEAATARQSGAGPARQSGPEAARQSGPGPARQSGGAPAGDTDGQSFDELAFLSSVVGAGKGHVEPRRTPPRSAAQEKLAEAEAASAAANQMLAPSAAPVPSQAPEPIHAPAASHASAASSVPLAVSAPEPELALQAPDVEHDPEPEQHIESQQQADSPLSGVRGSGTGVIRTQSASEVLLDGLATRKERGADGQPLGANVPGHTPIQLRASGAIEQSKTLKCTECGAMNYATEWYCERCGAELAAL